MLPSTMPFDRDCAFVRVDPIQQARPDVKVHLTLSEAQAKVVQRALEFYARIGIGQFEEIAATPQEFGLGKPLDQRRAELGAALAQAKKVLLPDLSPHGSLGIMQALRHHRLAVDVHDVLRHALSWHRKPEGGWTVDFDPPFHCCKEVPLAEVRIEHEQAESGSAGDVSGGDAGAVGPAG